MSDYVSHRQAYRALINGAPPTPLTRKIESGSSEKLLKMFFIDGYIGGTRTREYIQLCGSSCV